MGHRNRAEINQHSARGSDQFIEICSDLRLVKWCGGLAQPTLAIIWTGLIYGSSQSSRNKPALGERLRPVHRDLLVLYYSGHCRRLVKGFAVASISRRLIDVLARCGLLLALAFVAQCRAQTAPSGMQVFNFLDYGAKNDASALATGAFGCAIQAAKAAGGGTVYVPPGKYTSGPIELFSNMTLDVDSGATHRRKG